MQLENMRRLITLYAIYITDRFTGYGKLKIFTSFCEIINLLYKMTFNIIHISSNIAKYSL